MSLAAIAQSDPDMRIETVAPARSGPVHLALAGCSAVMLVFCVFAARRGAMRVGIQLLEATVLILPPLLVIPSYYHERKAWDRRDAALMLPWTLLIAALVTQVAPTTAAHAFPLQDATWRGLDEDLGISIPAIMTFTRQHPILDELLTFSYYWTLHPLMLVAIFVPALTGRRYVAQRFVLTNAIGFVVALPCMLLLPAVGPWAAWHFAPNPMQHICELSIYSLRGGSISSSDSFGGIICFPSFHVFWALVSAYALQSFRPLRYPAILIAALISMSTMSTGWHYGVDVLSGVLLAVVCTLVADAILRTPNEMLTN